MDKQTKFPVAAIFFFLFPVVQILIGFMWTANYHFVMKAFWNKVGLMEIIMMAAFIAEGCLLIGFKNSPINFVPLCGILTINIYDIVNNIRPIGNYYLANIFCATATGLLIILVILCTIKPFDKIRETMKSFYWIPGLIYLIGFVMIARDDLYFLTHFIRDYSFISIGSESLYFLKHIVTGAAYILLGYFVALPYKKDLNK